MSAAQPITDGELDGLFGWLRPHFPLTLAVSGGPDSMAMMQLMARWLTRAQAGDASSGTTHAETTNAAVTGAQARNAQARCAVTPNAAATDGGIKIAQVAVVTVDHGLRPGSGPEAAFVKRQAEALGFFHETRAWQDDKPVTGLQAAAREARYRLIGAFHRQYWHGAEVPPDDAAPGGMPVAPGGVVTAHHQDDQAETLLMRLARGSGVDGLAGMSALSVINFSPPADGPFETLKILRPLLGLSKARLAASLAADKVDFVEDPSNHNRDFERVRLRAARPALEAAGLHNDMLARTARRAARARACLEVATTLMAQRAQLQIHDLGYGALDHAVFGDACEELRIRLLGRLLALLGGAARGANPAQGLRLSKLEDLAARLAPSAEQGRFAGATLAGCFLTVEHGRIMVFRETGRTGLPEVEITPGQARLWDGRFQLSVDRQFEGRLAVSALGAGGWAQLKADFPALADHAVPARGAVTLPVFRWREAGDDGPASPQRQSLLAVPSLAAVEPKLAGPMRHGRPRLLVTMRRPSWL